MFSRNLCFGPFYPIIRGREVFHRKLDKIPYNLKGLKIPGDFSRNPSSPDMSKKGVRAHVKPTYPSISHPCRNPSGDPPPGICTPFDPASVWGVPFDYWRLFKFSIPGWGSGLGSGISYFWTPSETHTHKLGQR